VALEYFFTLLLVHRANYIYHVMLNCLARTRADRTLVVKVCPRQNFWRGLDYTESWFAAAGSWFAADYWVAAGKGETTRAKDTTGNGEKQDPRQTQRGLGFHMSAPMTLARSFWTTGPPGTGKRPVTWGGHRASAFGAGRVHVRF